MANRTFIDTNVFVYAVDTSEPDKRLRAIATIEATIDEDAADLVVSTQVLNEFYVIATRKLAIPLPPQEAATAVAHLSEFTCVPIDAELVARAVEAGQRWRLSHWDALMVEAARQAGCNRILTEDLADGAVYDGLRVENPFLAATTVIPG